MNIDELIVYNESSKENPKWISGQSAWVQHIPFGMFLARLFKPSILVELGSYYGDSYGAFCQVVKKYNLDTKLYAIDTWSGTPVKEDPSYRKEAYDMFHNAIYPEYSDISTTYHMSFDEAVLKFKDKSIELLHIDGDHSYSASKHDFEVWLPKMTDNGIILFHDIAVRNMGEDFGVWRLWDELKEKYSTFEFSFGYGLGVLAVNKIDPKVAPIFDKSLDRHKLHSYFEIEGSKIK